jgi:hypothetical protein
MQFYDNRIIIIMQVLRMKMQKKMMTEDVFQRLSVSFRIISYKHEIKHKRGYAERMRSGYGKIIAYL